MFSKKELLRFVLSEYISFYEFNEAHKENIILAKKELAKVQKLLEPKEKKPPLDCVDIIEAFKNINPMVGRLYGMKSQRDSADRLIKQLGKEKVLGLIKVLEEVNKIPYAPVITTPIQLEMKMGALKSFFDKSNNNQAKRTIGVAF